jgi:hypothetical protein
VAQGRVRLERADGAELYERGRAVQIRNFCGFAHPAERRLLPGGPPVPDEARQVAVEKAEAGEEITVATAKEIVAEAKRKRRPRRQKAVPAEKLGLRLVGVLERNREQWNPKELSRLARQLREFADALEKPQSGSKKKAKD